MKKRKITLFIILIMFISLSIIFISGCKKEERVEAKIFNVGVMLPLTGNISFIGENFRNGMLLAKKENKSDIEIKFLFEDHKNSSKEAISIYKKFLNYKQMPIIIPTLTSITNSIIPLAKESPRLLIGSIISQTDMPDKCEWLFRYFLSTKNEVNTMVNYFNLKSINEVGVFYVNDDYGIDATEEFRKIYKGNIVFNESFEKTSHDFKNLVPKARSAKAVYILGYGSTYGTFVKQLRMLGYKGKIFAFSSFSTPIVIKEAGEHGEGVIFTGTVFSYKEKNKELSSFIERYKSNFRKEPDHYSAYGYDIGNIILRAIIDTKKRKEEIEIANLKNTILSWKKFNGLFGESRIVQNKDFLFEEVYLYSVDKNGKIFKLN
jgi:branched-chain amino acid transport system substrate-binding protein